MVQIKSAAQVAKMRSAGGVVGETLAVLREAVEPGITPRDLNAIGEKEIRARGAVPSFLGYYGFPATLCISVNDEVVHGIPGDRPLESGDIVSIDCGAILDGWHGDAAITVGVGEIAPDVAALVRVCEESLEAGIAAMRPGRRVRDIGTAVEKSVRAAGPYGIVEDYGGHGIGTEMHQDPHVLNYRTRARGPKLVAGLVLAIEPMITMGSAETRLLDDEWTVKTADGSWAAHFEHTVAVTPDGPWVLTTPE
ncbi:MAG TPA: type I methionyl aminopeptidase [Jiangellaceae bacterium]